MTWTSNVIGATLPAEEIIAIAHHYGARVLIDGVQTVPKSSTRQILSWMLFSIPYRFSVNIEIEVFGQLLPGSQRKQSLKTERPMNVQEVVAWLGLNPQKIGLIAINSVQSEMDDPVPPDSRLCFFPHMSGG